MQDHPVERIRDAPLAPDAPAHGGARSFGDERVTPAGDGDVGVRVELGDGRLTAGSGPLEAAHRRGAVRGEAPREQIVQRRLDRRRVDDAARRSPRRARRLHERRAQRAEPRAARGRDRHDRTAEPLRQHVGVDDDVPGAGDVDHGQRHDQRPAELDELCREVQIALDVGGIDDVQEHVGRAFERVVAGDALVEGKAVDVGVQGVGARQVDHLDIDAGMGEAPGLLLDRDARPVADILAKTGERVEEGRLARVGVADHRDLDDGHRARSSSSRTAASARRRLKP